MYLRVVFAMCLSSCTSLHLLSHSKSHCSSSNVLLIFSNVVLQHEELQHCSTRLYWSFLVSQSLPIFIFIIESISIRAFVCPFHLLRHRGIAIPIDQDRAIHVCPFGGFSFARRNAFPFVSGVDAKGKVRHRLKRRVLVVMSSQWSDYSGHSFEGDGRFFFDNSAFDSSPKPHSDFITSNKKSDVFWNASQLLCEHNFHTSPSFLTAENLLSNSNEAVLFVVGVAIMHP